MSDLVKEIRDNGKNGWCGYCEQAADAIERLTAEAAGWKKAYEEARDLAALALTSNKRGTD